METLKTTDSAQAFVKGINDNFTEAGISTQFSKDVSASDIVFGLNSAFSGITGDINTINKDVSAPDFVASLNHNFGEYNQGGDTPSSDTISIPMQGGKMENGYAVGRITTASNFLNYRHSVNMIGISGCTLAGVTKGSGETLTIFCYDSNGGYLSSVSTVGNIPSAARYVKIMLNQGTAYTAISNLTVSYTGNEPTLHKNTVSTLEAQKDVSFETSIASVYPNEGFVTDNNRYYDNGFIKLPSNYTMDGNPVPLVVFVHGTTGHEFSGTNSTYNTYYQNVQDFVVKNGYALCDCSGVTSKNQGVSNTMCAPSFAASIVNEVQYLMRNYNIRQTGIYLYSKSSGGLMVNLPLLVNKLHSLFTLNAVGALAPSLSPMVSMHKYIGNSVNGMNVTASELGLGTPFTASVWENADKNVVLNNISLWRKVDALFNNSLTDTQTHDAVEYCYNADLPDLSKVAAAKAICDTAYRETIVPTKLWNFEADAAVYNGMGQMMGEMANRNPDTHPEYTRVLLKIADGYNGAHHADDGANAKTENYTLPNGTVVEASSVYVQLVTWFNQYETQYNQND